MIDLLLFDGFSVSPEKMPGSTPDPDPDFDAVDISHEKLQRRFAKPLCKLSLQS
jgi:hypothetical protein